MEQRASFLTKFLRTNALVIAFLLGVGLTTLVFFQISGGKLTQSVPVCPPDTAHIEGDTGCCVIDTSPGFGTAGGVIRHCPTWDNFQTYIEAHREARRRLREYNERQAQEEDELNSQPSTGGPRTDI